MECMHAHGVNGTHGSSMRSHVARRFQLLALSYMEHPIRIETVTDT